MAENRGKQFENVVKNSFEKVPNTSVVRLHDQTNGYLGSSNICDFIVYHYPKQYFIECKSVHGNILPFSNITKNQRLGLLKVCKIKGVVAGILCWWVDKDTTLFIPIQLIVSEMDKGNKSIRYDTLLDVIRLPGKKRRVFYDYDMKYFFVTDIYKEGLK